MVIVKNLTRNKTFLVNGFDIDWKMKFIRYWKEDGVYSGPFKRCLFYFSKADNCHVIELEE